MSAQHTVLTHMTFPLEHGSRIHSSNPLERVKREVKRRTNVLGILPNAASVLPLLGSVLIEVHDERRSGRAGQGGGAQRQMPSPSPQ